MRVFFFFVSTKSFNLEKKKKHTKKLFLLKQVDARLPSVCRGNKVKKKEKDVVSVAVCTT